MEKIKSYYIRQRLIKRKLAYIAGCSGILLLIFMIMLGGIPTDAEDIVLVFSAIYIPLLLLIRISLIGFIGADDRYIKMYAKRGMVYLGLVALVYSFIYLRLYFYLALYMFGKIIVVLIVSLTALIIILKEVNCKINLNN